MQLMSGARDEPNIKHYRVDKLLGSGGMGEVFLAFDERLHRKVALKCVQRDASKEYKSRLIKESELLAQLNHPNIVQIYDVITEEPDYFIVMEYIEGSDLESWLNTEPRGLPEKLEVAIQILYALQEAHKKNIVHRDLKFSNILISDDNVVKLTDFGIAKSLYLTESQLTQTGNFIGSFSSLSPEQISMNSLDQRSDLFAFGLLLFQLLSGVHPFGDTKDGVKIVHNILYTQPSDISKRCPALPAGLAGIIERLLEKSPERRPSNASIVVKEIKEVLQHLKNTENTKNLNDYKSTKELGQKISNKKEIAAQSRFSTVKSRFSLLALMVFVLALAAASALKILSPSTSTSMYVVALPPKTVSLDKNVSQTIPKAVHNAVIDGIMSVQNNTVVSLTEISDYAGSPAKIGRDAGSQEVVTTDLNCENNRCAVELTRINSLDGSILNRIFFRLHTHELKHVHDTIWSHTQNLYPHFSISEEDNDLRISESAYLKYLQWLENYTPGQRDPTLEKELQEFITSWPYFIPIYDFVTQYYTNLFYETQENNFLVTINDLLERGLLYNTNAKEITINQIQVALKSKNLDKIPNKLQKLAGQLVDSTVLAQLEAEYWQKMGRYEQAIAAIDKALILRNSISLNYRKALNFWILGDTGNSRALLKNIIGRNENYIQAVGLLADISLIEGDAPEAIKQYEKLIQSQKTSINYNNLGLANYLTRNFEQAKLYFTKAHELSPENPSWLLNLADSEWLTGNHTTANALYNNVLQLLDSQNEGELDYFTIKAQALVHLGHEQEALLNLRKAMALGPNSIEALFTAALIYTLIGESKSALVHQRLALEQGMSAKWFDTPWFDSLSENTESHSIAN